MTTTIHFNTGRNYTKHGQRITATLHDDGVVTFWDHDRMVHGEFLHAVPEWPFNQAVVMDAYDTNTYKNTTRAWQDSMLVSSINGTFKETGA
ncbi:hypothetical protein [Mesorhizobium sp. M0767]|uniref:hypothetical protein n=1 Tax=Mesorhizobium sp. M0767 TaxID=2956995 RepID=UPI0033356CA5